MPFSEDFEDVYQVGIKPACKDAGGYCERVDEQIYYESILDRVYNQINKADLIVSDMTNRNPNVFYETGYAHALGKKVILLTQNSDDIPFDLKPYPHIIYSGKIAELKKELEKRVRWYLVQSQTPVDENAFEKIHFFISGEKIVDNGKVSLPKDELSWNEDYVWINSAVSLHNPTNHPINPDFQIGFIFPATATFRDNFTDFSTRLPDGRILTEVHYLHSRIGPFCWTSSHFNAKIRTTDFKEGGYLPIIMRIFHKGGIKDIKFNVKISNEEGVRSSVNS